MLLRQLKESRADDNKNRMEASEAMSSAKVY